MIVFKRFLIPGLYAYLENGEWKGYILPPADHLPNEITLEDSWKKYNGFYLFSIGNIPLYNTEFFQTITVFLKRNYPYYKTGDRCFIWFNTGGNPDVREPFQFAQVLVFDKSGTISKNGEGSQQLWFSNSGYFAVAPYSMIKLNDAKNALLISRTAASLASKFEYGLYLTNKPWTVATMRLGKIKTNKEKLSLEPPLSIPFTEAAGAIQFELSFPFQFANPKYFVIQPDTYPYDPTDFKNGAAYTILPAGCKYYFKNHNWVELTYNLFGNQNAVDFKGSFNPSSVFNEHHTFFAFKARTQLETYIPTAYGKPISLSSCPNAKLLFARAPQNANGLSRYYWTLAGDFTLLNGPASADHPEQNRLLCGVSGTETISFTGKTAGYAGDMISFTPNQNALAPIFPVLDEECTGQPEGEPLLNSELTTAWVSFKSSDNPPAPISYYSQPEGAPLFEPSQTSGVLTYAEARAASLNDISNACFPLVNSATATPVLGQRKKDDPGYYDQEAIRQFELQILNPTRKQLITGARKALKQPKKSRLKAQEDHQLSTTPQGLLVNLNADKSAWQSITLANPDLEEKKAQPLMFKQLETKGATTGIQAAFQTNEQFLVISNPVPGNLDYYRSHFQDKIDIAAWPFILDLTGKSNWTSSTGFNNIVIFKFCNYSVEERIKNRKLWTDPLNFNESGRLDDLSTWLLDYIDAAKKDVQENGKNSAFSNFVGLVTNPGWNGILCLQVTLDLSTMPKEIKSILAGIDVSRFTAHHFGIEANHIGLTDKGELDTAFKSSMFGLISYFDATYEAYQRKKEPRPILLPATNDTYDFKVLELQVLFDKSLVKDFKSKIQLSLNTLFNEPVTSESNATNKYAINQYSIVMDGLYDKRNGTTAYTFAIDQPNVLGLASAAIQDVNIQTVQLAAVGQASAEQVTTRFYISGSLQFATLPDFDLFSYQALPFSNLVLDMKFNLNVLDPESHTPKKTFLLQPGGLVFGKTGLLSRPGSLVPHFPLELAGLLYHSPETATEASTPVTPASLAYLPVDAPLPTNPVSATWYGLRFNLNLGSMGALTAKIGFQAEILMAWSPGVTKKQVQVFIKMPFTGTTPNKGFSLQGVIKFAVDNIQFVNTPAGEKMQYALVLSQVGLSMLGLKLPRSGDTVFYLFGNPDEQQQAATGADSGNLGWFGAYKSKPKKEEKKKPQSINP